MPSHLWVSAPPVLSPGRRCLGRKAKRAIQREVRGFQGVLGTSQGVQAQLEDAAVQNCLNIAVYNPTQSKSQNDSI